MASSLLSILSKGVAIDRLVGFQDLGTKDDFTTTKLESVLIKKGVDPSF